MNRKETGFPGPDHIFLKVFFYLLAFRLPMQVTQVKVFPECQGRPAYYVCPRCKSTMEREFMSYCDRCGQHLDWHGYRHAEVIYQSAHK